MKIRRAELNDYERIARVHALSFYALHKGLVPENYLTARPVAAFIDRWKERLLNDDTQTLVAEANSDITGFICFKCPDQVHEESIEVLFLYVHPKHWSKGIGRELIYVAADKLFQAGFKKIYGWVLEASEECRGFYESIGITTNGITRITVDEKTGIQITEIYYAAELPLPHIPFLH